MSGNTITSLLTRIKGGGGNMGDREIGDNEALSFTIQQYYIIANFANILE